MPSIQRPTGETVNSENNHGGHLSYVRCAPSSIRRLCLMGVAALAAFTAPCGAEIIAQSGTFTGVYHRDRWGIGRFGIYLVSPKLHGQLKEFEDRPISLDVKTARQVTVPGPCEILEIGRIQPLESPKIELKLVLVRNDDLPRGMVEFACFVRNFSGETIEFSSGDLVIRVYAPRPVKHGNARHIFFPDFTNHQMWVHDIALLQWLNANFVETWDFAHRGNMERGHRVCLAARERVAFVMRRELTQGEYEARVRFRSLPANVLKWDVETWKSFDLPVERKAAEKNRRDDPLSGLALTNVEYRAADPDVARLSFTIRNKGSEPRQILACVAQLDTPDARFAGVVSAFDGAGNVLDLHVIHESHCLKTNEPWRLVAVGRDGLRTTVDINKRLSSRTKPKRFKLQILTERGLAAFWVDM